VLINPLVTTYLKMTFLVSVPTLDTDLKVSVTEQPQSGIETAPVWVAENAAMLVTSCRRLLAKWTDYRPTQKQTFGQTSRVLSSRQEGMEAAVLGHRVPATE
jgi:hypothetical protein